MNIVSRCARPVMLLGAIWLAGCQSLPSNLPQEAPPPQKETPRQTEVRPPALPAPVEKAAPAPSPQAVERALATHITQRYRVASPHATRVVRVAGNASKFTGLSHTLILAVIAVESSFNPSAVSSKGARGLMQVMPHAHPEKVRMIGGVEMLHDVETGIHVGARILREYHVRSGSLRLALQRYSGGASNYEDKVLARKRDFDRHAGILQAEGDGDDLLAPIAQLLQPLTDMVREIVAPWLESAPDS